jgi:hypothetical protein
MICNSIFIIDLKAEKQGAEIQEIAIDNIEGCGPD